MGLFGKKVKFDDDMVAPAPLADILEPAPIPLTERAPASVFAPTPPPSIQHSPPPQAPRAAFGIDDAIRLMHSLPLDRNPDLVIRVMKQTLESMNVRVDHLFADADRKEAEIQARMASTKADIAELEAGLRQCRDDLSKMEADLTQIGNIKLRLRITDSGNAKVLAIG